DAAEEMGIGQRALDRVLLARQSLVKLLAARLEWLEAARIQGAKRVASGDHLHRCALLRARFREEQRAVLELEGGEHELRRGPFRLHARAAGRPFQAAGDHQVKNQKQLAIGWRSAEAQ